MKILQVIQRYPPAIGGGEEVVYQLSKELVKLGHDVTVVTSNWELDTDVIGISSSRINLKPTHNKLPNFEIIDGIKIYRYKPLLRLWSYAINFGMMKFLFDNIDEYDIVNSHYYLFIESDIVSFLSKIKKIPFILTIHRSFSAFEASNAIYLIFKKLYDLSMGKFTLNTAKKIIVLTPEIKDEFLNLGISEEKIIIIPNGIDLEIFSPRVKSEKIMEELGKPNKIVLSVGRLEKQKGMQYIIGAIPEICKVFPNTKFVFVGEDWGYKNELIRQSLEINVANKCIFTDNLEREKLVNLYVNADVFVLPAIGEGFGLVALESIACGTPVVLLDSDALKHILSEIGGNRLNKSKDISGQIAQYAIKIFQSPNIMVDVEKQRKILEKNYFWPAIVVKLESIYEGVRSANK